MTEETRHIADRPFAARVVTNGLLADLGRWQAMISEGAAVRGALVVIVVLAALLRLTALNWDDNNHLHPDERHMTTVTNDIQVPRSIAAYFDTNHSRLNPYTKAPSFVYGTVPLFLGKVASEVSGHVPMVDDHSGYDGIAIIGRALSALFDIGTVVFVFLLARRLFGARAGLIAALLYAFSPLAIQHAHFYVADPFMTFFATAAIYYAVRIVQEGRRRDYVLGGLMVGLATASKLTAVSLVPVVGLAALIRAWPAIEGSLRQLSSGSGDALPLPKDRTLGHAVRGTLLALVVAFAIFRIGQPYAFQSPGIDDLAIWQSDFHCQHHCTGVTLWAGRVLNLNPQWVDDQINQQELLNGGSWPPNVQWIGRQHWVWPLQQMIIWGMGPAFGLAAWAGFFYAGWSLWKRREFVLLVPLAWVAGYFMFMGGQFTLYLRYFLPLYPTLAAFAAALLFAVWTWAGQMDLRRLRLPPVLTQTVLRTIAVAVPVLTVLWGLAYFHIYSKPVTRIDASRWVFANVPAGSTIGIEHWDDQVPFSLAGIGDGAKYQYVTFNNYDIDDEQKVSTLVANLDRVDYISISSDRLLKTIPRVPVNFPVTTKYYRSLQDGSLGFKLAGEFRSYPKVLGITIPDRGAEEAWNVYDHPPVEIFQKTPAYSHDRTVAVLGADAFVPGMALTPKDAAKNALLLKPDALQDAQSGGTFTSIFSDHSIPNRIPLWTWLFVVELISFAVLPVALVLFRALPDRGYLLAKPLGFLVLGYVVWLGATLRIVEFSRGTISVVLVLMLLAGAAVGYLTRDGLRTFFRERWRSILFWEGLFLTAFLILYLIRLSNPDLWHPARGGEKPMDFAYFNAIVRSTHDPPYDPWFAGGYMNYYYFGQWLAATLTKFTGILPEVAYNLAIPLFFALAVGATYSVAYNLAEATRQYVKRRPQGGRIGSRGPVLAGLGAVVLVMFSGNLGGMRQLVDNLSHISAWHSSLPVVGGVVGTLGGAVAVIFQGKHLDLPTDWYWASSRMMPPKISITEFPYFSFLFADLHAHLIAIPFALTSLGIGAALVLNASRLMRESVRYRTWAGWGLVVVLALVIGALRWINSWDYPTFLLMGVGAIFIAEFSTRRSGWSKLGQAGLKSIALIGLSLVLFAPFQAHYQLPATGFHVMDERETTPMHQYLAHFGVFLFLIAGFVGFLALRRRRRFESIELTRWLLMVFLALLLGGAAIAGTVGWVFSHSGLPFTARGLSFGGFLRDTVGGILAPLPGQPIHTTDHANPPAPHDTPVVAFVLGVLAVLLVVGWTTLRRPRGANALRLFVLGMLVLGLFLSAGVEMAALDGDIQRMNTVFKFYLHIWLLFGLVAAFGAWYLLDVVRPKVLFDLKEVNLRPAKALAPAFAVAAAGFVIAALVYPVFATPQRVQDRFDNASAIQPRTDNGLDYMLGATFNEKGTDINLVDDYAAIQWLRHNVDGSPTIIEAITPLYHWGSRMSINTGLPDVMGWPWHQEQQRGKFSGMVQTREQDVNTFYSTPDPVEAQKLLKEYGVRYVVLGQLEKVYYPGQGVANIEAGLGGMLRKVFEYGQTQIYEVVPNPLLESARAQ